VETDPVDAYAGPSIAALHQHEQVVRGYAVVGEIPVDAHAEVPVGLADFHRLE
jgi:hypothetical protein